MPSYTFRCPKCSHEFSDLFPMRDSGGENLVCPECGVRGVKRVYKGAPGVIIKSGISRPSCPTCSGCSGGVCG